ncbi:MAG TPA: hypothetical protein DHN33_03575 [Eubacteriaceae bacterium]|nr:hypothetical protein [Eubacteriaceae bacterium]
MKDINLIPAEIYLKKQQTRKKIHWIVRGLLILVILSVGYTGLYMVNQQIEQRISEVEETIGEKEEILNQRNDLERMKEQIIDRQQTITKMELDHINYYDLAQQIKQAVPQGITLHTQTALQGILTLEGTASNRESVGFFADRLRRTEGFTDVWIHYGSEDDGFEFEISLRYAIDEGDGA